MSNSGVSLILRLREGLLPTDDWSEVAKSRASLKARICKLRAKGYSIASIEQDNLGRRGRPAVTYRLDGEPDQALCCRHCGGAL